MRQKVFGGAVLGVLFLAATAAQGQTQNYYNICDTSDGYKICASSIVTWDGSDLVMQVWNMEGMGTASMFGLAHTMSSVGLSINSASQTGKGSSTAPAFSGFEVLFGGTDVSQYWAQGAQRLQLVLAGSTQGSGGHDGGINGCTLLPGNHLQTCLNYPTSPYLQFTFSGFDSNFVFADFNTFEYHSQQTGNNAGSMKVRGGENPPPPPPPTEVVPEPITMILLGSGLLGVGGAANRRRRREAAIENA
jgi:hypothetical protein